MPTVRFTTALQRFFETPPAQVTGDTVAAALAAAFDGRQQLRGYVLDDQGAVRRHVAVYVNGEPIADRIGLQDPVGPADEIYILQALSGG